jgi:single-strand DNA-binding protein
MTAERGESPGMAYELEGTLKEIFQARTFGKGFTKRDFVVTTSKGPEDRYPQHIKLSVVKDKCPVLDRFKPGQRIKVSFDLRGSEYQGKYFTELQAWKIENTGQSGDERSASDDEPAKSYGQERTDDMPF